MHPSQTSATLRHLERLRADVALSWDSERTNPNILRSANLTPLSRTLSPNKSWLKQQRSLAIWQKQARLETKSRWPTSSRARPTTSSTCRQSLAPSPLSKRSSLLPALIASSASPLTMKFHQKITRVDLWLMAKQNLPTTSSILWQAMAASSCYLTSWPITKWRQPLTSPQATRHPDLMLLRENPGPKRWFAISLSQLLCIIKALKVMPVTLINQRLMAVAITAICLALATQLCPTTVSQDTLWCTMGIHSPTGLTCPLFHLCRASNSENTAKTCKDHLRTFSLAIITQEMLWWLMISISNITLPTTAVTPYRHLTLVRSSGRRSWALLTPSRQESPRATESLNPSFHRQGRPTAEELWWDRVDDLKTESLQISLLFLMC